MSALRTRWRDALVIGAAVESLALALWLIPASQHIVAWPAAGLPVRISYFASVWQLAVLTASAALVTAALVLGVRGDREKLARSARVLAPLGLLGLWAVPYLPWLPAWMPLLLVLTGPLRWAIAAVAFVWVGHRLSGDRVRRIAARVTAADRRTVRHAVFLVSLVLYAGFGLYWVRTIGVDGDEPHFLIISESLLRDGDIRIENNHRQRDYLRFYPNDLPPHYVARGREGVIYSHHAPGLAVLILPAYLLAGHAGAVVFIAILGAFAALAIFDLALQLTGMATAVLTWAAACLTVPFVPYAWKIFPEMPATLIVAWAALWLWRAEQKPAATWLLRGAVISVLPWLHIKFSILAASLVVALAIRLRNDFTKAAALLAPFAVSGTAWLTAYFVMYGTFDPTISFGEGVSFANIPHGLLGLFFDEKFGLLLYSPIFLAAIPGGWRMIRDRETRFLALSLLGAAAIFILSSARLYIFWGGLSAPARFLVPMVPCFAPMIAITLAHARSGAVRALVPLWLCFSVAVATAGIVEPYVYLLFSEPHGDAALARAIQGGSPLPYVLPTFTDPDWSSNVPLLMFWIAAAAAAFLAAVVASRRSNSLVRVALAGSLAFLVLGSAVTAAPASAVRRATVEQGTLAAIWRMGRGNEHVMVPGPSDPAGQPPPIAIPLHWQAANGSVGTAPIDLPAGTYAAEVWFASPRPGEGRLRVASRRAEFGSTDALTNPTIVRFHLPVAVRRVALQVTGTKTPVDRMTIVPEQVVALRDREPWAVRDVENVAGHPGAYIVYTDPHAYLEGGQFWTSGTNPTTVFVAPDNAARLTVTVTNGPEPANVRVAIAGREQIIAMSPREVRPLTVDLRGERLVPLVVQSSVTFRPADAGMSDDDTRDLGCHVSVSVD